MILLIWLGFFVLCLVVMGPFAIMQMVKAKPFACPQCSTVIKMTGNRGKCNRCKVKLFKHSNGKYMQRA